MNLFDFREFTIYSSGFFSKGELEGQSEQKGAKYNEKSVIKEEKEEEVGEKKKKKKKN